MGQGSRPTVVKEPTLARLMALKCPINNEKDSNGIYSLFISNTMSNIYTNISSRDTAPLTWAVHQPSHSLYYSGRRKYIPFFRSRVDV